MNKRRIIIWTAAVFFAMHLTAFADGLIDFPTSPAAWTVDVTASNLGGAFPAGINGHPTKIEVTQDGQKRRSFVTWSNGNMKESWYILNKGLILVENPSGDVVLVSDTGTTGGVLAIPFMSDAFQWLSPQFLQEKDPVNYKGKQCFHYKGKIVYGQGTATTSVPCEAWIDSTTLFPVALDTGVMLGTYTFSKIPSPPLVMSAKFQSALGP